MDTPDGEKLHAFLMLQDSPRDKKTIFMCHANAGNMGHRVPIAAKFYRSFGWNVFIFSYRGYLPVLYVLGINLLDTGNLLDLHPKKD